MTKVAKTLNHVLKLLSKKDYKNLEKLTNGIRLPAGEMEIAINDYNATIIIPPDSVYNDLDIIEIKDSSPRAWSVRFDLWTKEEGESDLSLELTLIMSNDEFHTIEIDNIHVM